MDRSVNEIVVADIPLTVHELAKMYAVAPAMVLQATREYSASKGKVGLRSFKFPGQTKVRIRPSAFLAWMENLEIEVEA